MAALTKVHPETNFTSQKASWPFERTITAGRADCPRFDRPAGQRTRSALITKEGVRMTGPVFPAVVARFLCASDSHAWEVVDGNAFEGLKFGGPKARALRT